MRLRDVGRAELGAEDYSSSLDYNGNDSVGLGITQLSTANAIDVDRRCIAELARLAKRFPPGMKYELAFDTTDAVGESIRDVVTTLGEAILLVILVIFVFLEDWRSTIIPAVTIPVSLIGTFAFVKLLGFSINTLTLFGITLATGLVVDDAIVVIENIQRHLQEGELSPLKAASDAMKEVTGAVIATSLVLVAVFVPVAFFPGTTGILFRQFALTIAFSISISAFNALTLTPALSALLLGREHGEKNWFFKRVDRFLSALTNGYVRALRTFLRFEIPALILFAAGLVCAYLVFQRVPKGFVPTEDQGYLIVAIQAPTGASLEYTRNIGRQVEAITKNFSEIEGTFSVAGFSFGGDAPNAGLVFLPLRPYAQRKGKEHTAANLIGRLRPQLFGISGALVIAFEPPAVQGLGEFGGFQFQLQDQGNHTLQDIDKTTHDLMRAGNQRKDLAGLFSTYTASDPQLVVTIDREKAKSLHVPLSQIIDTLSIYMGSAYINDFDFNNRSYRVYVQADKQFRARPQDIQQYYVRSDSGAMVPLQNLLSITESAAPQVISHYNLFRAAEIDGSAAPGFSSGQAIEAMQTLASKMPQGYTYEWSGISLEELQSGSTTLILFGLGVLVVYLTLSAQYESFVSALHHLISRPHGTTRRASGAMAPRPAERCLLPGRTRHVGRLGLKKRNFNRRIRRATPRARHDHPRLRRRSRPHPSPPHSNDLLRLHLRSCPLGDGQRRRRERPSLGRHHSLRRHDHEHNPEPVLHPSPISVDRRFPRTPPPPQTHRGVRGVVAPVADDALVFRSRKGPSLRQNRIRSEYFVLTSTTLTA